jgi:hypothetical protein
VAALCVQDAGSGVGPANADVVQPTGVAEGELAVAPLVRDGTVRKRVGTRSRDVTSGRVESHGSRGGFEVAALGQADCLPRRGTICGG